MSFKKVAVIGAGTMGSGIAGQVANAGIDVWLLDLPVEGDEPNARAQRGLERIQNPAAPGLMSKEAEQFIHLGNTRDNFSELADCDWVVEAVVEQLDVKRTLYKQLDEVCNSTAIVSSNTSTIPIRLLIEEMPESFQQRFAITHFFNPVRAMPLLELVRGENTSNAVMDVLQEFCDKQLGKGVIPCVDTPGFLGNRVGCFAIQCALQAALEMGLSAQEADAVFGRPMGIPKTGVFGLYDLIGIDLMSDVAKSLVATLPSEDAFHSESEPVPLMLEMIEKGHTGQKQGQGFYRRGDNGTEVVNFKTGEYEAVPHRLNVALADAAERNGVKVLLDDDGKYGRFAWRVLSRVLTYSASLIPEVGDTPQGVDDAMKLGYNWIRGPFELLDDIGVDYFIARLEADDIAVPEFLRSAAGSSFYRVDNNELQMRTVQKSWEALRRPEGVMRFNEKRQTLTAENTCEVASWFVLDGVAIVEFHSKANALDGDSMAILADAMAGVRSKGLRGLVVHNDAQHFSCGVNLGAVRGFFEAEDMDGLDGFLNHFQQTVLAMAQAEFPVVCAPVGMSLGGGFEVVLHAKQVICHANSNMGLVESGVGLVPGGGGCKETLYRWAELLKCDDDISEASWKAFMNLGYGRTCSSPILARQQAMLRPNDSYLNNRDRLLPTAIAAINGMNQNGLNQDATNSMAGQAALVRPSLAMPGVPMFEKMVAWLEEAKTAGKLTPHNVVTATEIARIMSGGEIEAGSMWSEQDLFDAERSSFLRLVSSQATRDRICSMLDVGKAVQN
ncbi:MAG: 3-hydroxyacyl-CoA dehydrogenase NAD-binding domain-containing protein [Pseudomonadales bacterium]